MPLDTAASLALSKLLQANTMSQVKGTPKAEVLNKQPGIIPRVTAIPLITQRANLPPLPFPQQQNMQPIAPQGIRPNITSIPVGAGVDYFTEESQTPAKSYPTPQEVAKQLGMDTSLDAVKQVGRGLVYAIKQVAGLGGKMLQGQNPFAFTEQHQPVYETPEAKGIGEAVARTVLSFGGATPGESEGEYLLRLSQEPGWQQAINATMIAPEVATATEMAGKLLKPALRAATPGIKTTMKDQTGAARIPGKGEVPKVFNVKPLGAGDIAAGWQKTNRGRMIFKGDIELENIKEALVASNIEAAPSYLKLMAAYKRFMRTLYSPGDPYVVEKLAKVGAQPWDLLTAHSSVMNAKSSTAKTLRTLADAVFSETNLPRLPEGKFRGESGINWDAIKIPGKGELPKPPAEMKPPEVVTPEAVKQTWQMTKQEFLDSRLSKQGQRATKKSIGNLTLKQWREQEHVAQVGQALSEGKPVPPEVLKDYPDLVAKVKPPVEAAEGAKPVPVVETKPPVPEVKPEVPVTTPEQIITSEVPKPVVSKVKPPSGTVPPAPVVNPEGKLWLPEPPRTAAYMESARKEVAGSFKKKTGAFDVIEQAHQQVLKARDMGDNVVNYVGSYIRGAGNLTKEFGLDVQGMATKVGNPENRSLAINDILSNYTHYNLTPAQIEIAKKHGFVYKEALKLAKSYGVDISELGGADEYWQYIARKVKGKLNPVTGEYEMPPSGAGGFRMGAKISSQKERVFEEMAEGVDLGLLYEHPDQVMVQHIKGIYRLIGNKQAENTVKGLTREITAEAPLVFGERALAQPALRSRAAATDIANAIDRIFTPEQELKALRSMANVSGALVGQTAALDVSAPLIQGLPVLGHDLKMALKGKPTAIWAKAYGRMWKAVWNPKTIDAYRVANHELYKKAQEAGIITGQSEFVSGVPVTGRVLGKVPKVGKTLKEAYRQTWGRAGQAYSDFLEVSRIEMFKQMEGAWERSGGNVYDLGAVVNRMTGATSAAARGVGPNRRLAERIVAFAPNYLRASLLLIKDMAGRGATAKEVQSTMAALLGVGFAVYYAEEKVRGREPKIKPWPKRLGGNGADAFTTEINGYRVGLGSWMYGMIKTLAEVGAIAADDPSALVVFDEQHPVMRFIKSKQGPALSLTREMATGKTFWGKDFETPQDYLLRLVEAVTPIAGQSLVQKGTGLPVTAGERATPLVLDPLGLRVFPSNDYKFNKLAEDQGLAKGREWADLQPWEQAKLAMSPEGRTLIKALKQKDTLARWELRWDAYDKQVHLDTQFKAGAITASQWKDAYYEKQNELAARLSQFDEDFKRMKYNPVTPQDKAMSGYYETIDKANIGGIFDGEEWDRLRDEYMQTLSPELQKYVEENIGIYDTPLGKTFRQSRKALETYWGEQGADTGWRQYYREAYPEVDALVNLWGYASTVKTEEALEDLKQLASDLGMAPNKIDALVNAGVTRLDMPKPSGKDAIKELTPPSKEEISLFRLQSLSPSYFRTYIAEHADQLEGKDLTQYVDAFQQRKTKDSVVIKKYQEGTKGWETSLREAYRKDHPELDAMLNLWGEASVTLSTQAATLLRGMAQELGMPEEAIPAFKKKAPTKKASAGKFNF